MAAPSAPTLRAQGTGGTSVRVSIDPVSGATSYTLYRSSDAAFSDEAAIVTTPGVEVRPNWGFDTQVGYAESHWYRATATNADGTSAKGAAVRVNVIQDGFVQDPTPALRYERSDR